MLRCHAPQLAHNATGVAGLAKAKMLDFYCRKDVIWLRLPAYIRCQEAVHASYRQVGVVWLLLMLLLAPCRLKTLPSLYAKTLQSL